MNVRLARLSLLASVLLAVPAVAAEPVIAIIIDDLGYERRLGERAIALPGPVTFAVLPGTPNGPALARQAHESGREVLLHLPLQAMHEERPEEPGQLLLDMTRNEFRNTVLRDLEAVPYISGINTHRGSLLTRHPGHMLWLMEDIIDHGGLYFVDSYTTADSVALAIAEERGVPAIRRDVFLDPDRSPETIVREYARLKAVADEKGFAVGIGHPYPATLEFLERVLPTLADDGYRLVSMRDLVLPSQETAGDTPAVSGE